MKKLLLFALAGLTLFACKKDEDDDPDSSSNALTYVDQNLQGKIGGSAWSYISGKFEERSFDEDNYSIEMKAVNDTNLCSFFGGAATTSYILFSAPKKPGKYDLGFGTDSKTVTLYSVSDSVNNIATEGYYEIVSVDTAKGEMEIKMVVKADNDNMVNGKATLTFCK